MNFKKWGFFPMLNTAQNSYRYKPKKNIFIWQVMVNPIERHVIQSDIFTVGDSAMDCRLILKIDDIPAQMLVELLSGIITVNLSLCITKKTPEAEACEYFLFEIKRDRLYYLRSGHWGPRQEAIARWDCENQTSGEYKVSTTAFSESELNYPITIKVTWFTKPKGKTGLSGLDDDIGWLLNNGKFSDMVIETGDKTRYPVHQAILAARSPVFCAMFSNDTLEAKEKCVKITDLSAETVKDMLHFMYTGATPEFTCNSASNLIYAAEKYDLKYLKVICRHYLLHHISPSNAINLLLLADTYNDDPFKEEVLKFISENQKELSESGEFKKLLNDRPSLLVDVLNARVKA